MRLIQEFNWLAVSDGDPRAYAIFKRHYSFYNYADNRRRYGYSNWMLMLGPGEKSLYMTPECDAIWAWRKFIDASGQKGINNAIFRNESSIQSSRLILEAEELAHNRWPGQRMYTYIDDKAINSTQPGYCYQMARWKKYPKRTGSGKLIYYKHQN